ncbi:MAG: SAM-dependent methyltransferase, partial [Nitrospinota bacterium]|nr:SAM-dependent methyltransferase [Nitrospinota bacterium]
MTDRSNKPGKVALVGAGPGDEGLMTLRGKEWLERADVVVYDHLANERLLRFTQPGTEFIYAG